MVHAPRTPPPVDLTLLGRFELRVRGRPVTSLPKKACALLAYLAMEDGRPVSREAMADLLWTDRGAEQARHSLRQTLLVVRQELRDAGAPVIHSGGGNLRFTPDMVETNVSVFQRLADSNDRTELADAMRYDTHLLRGFPPIAAEFDDWLARMREQATGSVIKALGRLADFHLEAGEIAEAITVAERMLGLDPMREDLHRQLMTSYARAGRRSDALRQYQTCKEMLSRELGVPPAPETTSLMERIRFGNPTADGGTDDAFRNAPVRLFAQPTEGAPWIAVMPFRTIGANPQPDYFGCGLVEDIVCMLAALREPIVVSSNSTLPFGNQPLDLRRVGQELGVQYVVSGTVRQAGTRMRLNVELVQAATSAVLWGRSYDIRDTALFDAQDDIAAEIVTHLVPQVHQAELRRIRTKRPESMTAYDLVLQARELIFHLRQDSFERAGHLLREAVALDPRYAGAHALVADWYSLRLGQGWSNDSNTDAQALSRASEQAVSCDAQNARALALLGHNRTILDRDYESAQALFERALEAAPNDAGSWMWSSPTLAFIGNGAEAVRRAERALRLSPRDRFIFRPYHMLCIAHYTNGAYEEAAHWGTLSMQQNPHYTSNLRATAAALSALERVEEARAVVERVLEEQPDFRISRMIDRHPYRTEAMRKRYARHLAAAGLPE